MRRYCDVCNKDVYPCGKLVDGLLAAMKEKDEQIAILKKSLDVWTKTTQTIITLREKVAALQADIDHMKQEMADAAVTITNLEAALAERDKIIEKLTEQKEGI